MKCGDLDKICTISWWQAYAKVSGADVSNILTCMGHINTDVKAVNLDADTNI